MILEKNMRLAQRWFPKGSMAINHPDGLGVVYVSEFKDGKWQGVGYKGTEGKPSFNFSFRNREQAEKKVEEFFNGLLARKVHILERRKEQNKPHSLNVGDVITNSWGYDQTNVDCYQITRKTDHFVWLMPIDSQEVPRGEGFSPMSAQVVPVPGAFAKNGKEEKHKASGEYVGFKYGSGSKWDGKRSLYSSWYA